MIEFKEKNYRYNNRYYYLIGTFCDSNYVPVIQNEACINCNMQGTEGPFNPCKEYPCDNGGICTTLDGSKRACFCLNGFTGINVV